MNKKLFISHASEDKEAFVRPLAEALKERFDIWYDEYELFVGSSLLEEISKGLAASDFGIVVLSPHFFAKKWTQQELNGLFTLEEKDRKIILPIWKDITQIEVLKYSPILADRIAVKASQGVQAVVDQIERSIEFFERGKAVQRGSGAIERLSSVLASKAEIAASRKALETQNGTAIVNQAGKQFVFHANEGINALLRQSPECGIHAELSERFDHYSELSIWSGRLCLKFEYNNNVVNDASDARLSCSVFERRYHKLKHDDSDEIYKDEYAPFISSDESVQWRSDDGKLYDDQTLFEEWVVKFTNIIDNIIV